MVFVFKRHTIERVAAVEGPELRGARKNTARCFLAQRAAAWREFALGDPFNTAPPGRLVECGSGIAFTLCGVHWYAVLSTGELVFLNTDCGCRKKECLIRARRTGFTVWPFKKK